MNKVLLNLNESKTPPYFWRRNNCINDLNPVFTLDEFNGKART